MLDAKSERRNKDRPNDQQEERLVEPISISPAEMVSLLDIFEPDRVQADPITPLVMKPPQAKRGNGQSQKAGQLRNKTTD